jgi:hypothetical protein
MNNSKSTNSNTGYKGIYFDRDLGNFRVRISFKNEVWYTICRCDTLKEAVKAREDFIKSLF